MQALPLEATPPSPCAASTVASGMLVRRLWCVSNVAGYHSTSSEGSGSKPFADAQGGATLPAALQALQQSAAAAATAAAEGLSDALPGTKTDLRVAEVPANFAGMAKLSSSVSAGDAALALTVLRARIEGRQAGSGGDGKVGWWAHCRTL